VGPLTVSPRLAFVKTEKSSSAGVVDSTMSVGGANCFAVVASIAPPPPSGLDWAAAPSGRAALIPSPAPLVFFPPSAFASAAAGCDSATCTVVVSTSALSSAAVAVSDSAAEGATTPPQSVFQVARNTQKAIVGLAWPRIGPTFVRTMLKYSSVRTVCVHGEGLEHKSSIEGIACRILETKQK
jgi:hypothetical protein